MGVKLKYEDVKQYIEDEGYILISNEYVDSKQKITVRCPNNHEYPVSFGKFKVGRRCPYCSNRVKIAKEEVIKHVESEGYKLISNFKNGNEPIVLRCPNGHEWKVVYQRFKKGKRCSHCNNRYREYNGHTDWNIDLVRDYLQGEGYELISNIYYNAQTKILIKCPNGHEVDMYWCHFVKGHRCRKCAGAINGEKCRTDVKLIDECLNKEGYVRVGEFKNIHTPLEVICSNGHTTNIYMSNFTKGVRCKYCRYSTYEKMIIDYLDKSYIKYDREVTMKVEGRNMRMDFIVFNKGSDINYALEIDGKHHFEEINGFDTSLETYMERDLRKNKYCFENNITLYRIPYWDLDKYKVEELFNIHTPLEKYLIINT